MFNITKSLAVIAIVVAAAVGGTYAYFSSTATSTANTFSAGTLDVQVSNDNSTWAKGVSGTWVSPVGWAPGQTTNGTIHMTNVGTVNSNHVYFGFNSPTHSGGTGGVDLMDKIVVTNLQERFNNVTTLDQTATLAAQVGNKDNVLTLKELVDFSSGYGYYSWDDKSNDGIILQAGNQKDYDISFTFKFLDDAGNDYQGASAGFVVNMNATQNSPTDGMLRI
jgi:spore coat-associated protein N